jgi:Glycosyltransferase family 9 (heptosyltransferase)
MNIFKKPERKKTGTYDIAPNEIPAIRIAAAVENRTEKEICFVVGGGLGDRVCAEPTLRFALDTFKDVNISLICENPQLFSHLTFKEVFDLKTKHPIIGRHLYLYTYSTTPLINQFLNPNFCHCIDMPSMSAFRAQIPNTYKSIRIRKPEIQNDFLKRLNRDYVLLHLGKSWPSRTFPSKWWQEIIRASVVYGSVPVLVGNNCVELEETTAFKECVDLRDKLSLDEFIYACLECKKIITNDSSPVHLAAAGWARIAFVSTCRRGELITHWRGGEFGANMKDFAVGAMWKLFKMVPNTLDVLSMKDVPGNIEDFLPNPWDVVDWVCMGDGWTTQPKKNFTNSFQC